MDRSFIPASRPVLRDGWRARGAGTVAGLLLALLLPFGATAPLRADSLAGREFWFAWPLTGDASTNDPGYDLDGELILLALDGPVTASVTGPGISTMLTPAPGASAALRIPRSAMVIAEDVPVLAGIHVEAQGCARMAAFFRVPGAGASVGDDVMRLLPVSILGTRVAPVAYWGGSEVIVVATRDGTSVTINDPTCGSPPPVTLARGQAVMHRCVEAAGDGDITGTLVTASAPVAVHSGSETSSIVNHEGPRPTTRAFWGFGDVLLESPWPLDLLGREHAHAPLPKAAADASGDLLRLVAGCDATRVAIAEEAGTRSYFFARTGDHRDVESIDAVAQRIRLVPGAAHLTSDRASQIALMSVGYTNAGLGDPALGVLDPRERWEPNALVYVPPVYDSTMTIITATSETGSVRIDGAALAGAWAVIFGSDLSWIRASVAAGEHRVTGASPLSVQLFGHSPGAAGAYLVPAVPYTTSVAQPVRVEGADPCVTTCPGACRTLRAPAGTTDHRWFVDGVAAGTGTLVNVCPSATARVELLASDASGCAVRGLAVLHVLVAPDAPRIEGPSTSCAGGCVTLNAPPGYDTYVWDSGELTQAITVCPLVDTTYRVTVSDASGCGGVAQRVVTTYPAPVAGDAIVRLLPQCQRGIELTWLEAQWRPGSPGGVYNIYRRSGACAAVDDASWQRIAVGVAAPPYVDATAPTGEVVSYLVEAEDAPAPGPCNEGPAQAGSTDRRCTRPPSGLADPGDPDAPRLVSFSPHLRATGYTRATLQGPPLTVTFAWPTAPATDPATHVEAWRSARAWQLEPLDRSITGTSWTDVDPVGAWLYFYKVFNATECGTILP